MNQRLQLGTWALLAEDAGRVRRAVFIEEQGIDEALEWDAADADSLHAVVYRDGQPVATGRLLPDGRIGRMAVLPEHRREQLGSQVLRALMQAAGERGHREVELSAQTYVLAFYQAHGFVPFGPVYDDAGIEHQSMRCRLPPLPLRGSTPV